MKKVLFLALVVTGLFLATATMALAAGGPHGGFTATTDSCAGCHRTHTSAAPKLLLTQQATLCRSCHGSSGQGANTNVDDGKYLTARGGPAGGVTPNNADLLGGGFVTYKGVAATSSHSVDSTQAASWGNGASTPRGTTANLVGGVISCGSCHDPHGSTNYRILRTNVNNVAVTVPTVDEGAAKDYSANHWGDGNSQFCATCHTSYHKTLAGQGSTLDLGSYTHRIDMSYSSGGNVNPETIGFGGQKLPLANFGGADDKVVCQTCHLPHGTSAQMAGFAAGTFDPFGSATPPGPVPSADSALLRLDNRGVCEVCHQK